MLFDGKLDAVDLMAIEHEQRQTDLRRVIKYIKKNYRYEKAITLF